MTDSPFWEMDFAGEWIPDGFSLDVNEKGEIICIERARHVLTGEIKEVRSIVDMEDVDEP